MNLDEIILGPFISPIRLKQDEIYIDIIIVVYGMREKELFCELINKDEQVIHIQTPSKIGDQCGLFKFEVNLPKKYLTTKISYTFYTDQDKKNKLNLGKTLSYDDCYFDLQSISNENYSLIFMSCHNPFEEYSKSHNNWEMWDRLSEKVQEDKTISLIILGGDQIYTDGSEENNIEREIKNKYIKNIRENRELAKEDLDSIKMMFLEVYYKYWNHPSYRKTLSKIPSACIWDDHDITDGWGSRIEFFIGNKTNKVWEQYFNIAKYFFEEFQFSRSCNRVEETSVNYTHFVDIANSRIYFLDFRSERNIKIPQIWDSASESNFFKHLENTSANFKNIYIVSPVVPFRSNFGKDERMSGHIQKLFEFNYKLELADAKKYDRLSWEYYFDICKSLIPSFIYPILVILCFCLLLSCWCIIPISLNILSFLKENWLSSIFILGMVLYFIYLLYKRSNTYWLKKIIIALLFVGFLSLLTTITYCFIMKTTLWLSILMALSVCLAPYLLLIITRKYRYLIARFTDDLADGLTSEKCRVSFENIINRLFVSVSNYRNVTLLTGDIHLGGLTEIIQKSTDKSILQVVSSPISNVPMDKPAAGLTTTTSQMNLTEDIYARNIFYLSRRNFVQIFPNADEMKKKIWFYFANHSLPIKFVDKFH